MSTAVYATARRLMVPLTEHAEIVLEIGPRVPPHRRFTFPSNPAAGTR